jgi:choloylglycine hydrolase
MDLYQDDQPYLVIYPKNIARDGRAGENSLSWKSKYGSVVITGLRTDGTAEGMNEQGLAASILYLDKADYEKRNSKIPGVSIALWAQYILDNFKTVEEALDNVNKFQVVSTKVAGREWPFHLAIQDPSGNTAIIEFINGKMKIHHGSQYRVMANEPAYDIQLANLKKYKLFGGTLPMPGDVDSLSRFVRASSYLKTLPQPKDDIQAAAALMSVMRTVMVPTGAEDTSGNEAVDAWPTRWVTIKDLDNKVIYLSVTQTPNIVWIDFSKLKFDAGAPILGIDPKDKTLSGDISTQLKPYTPPSVH